ncbi:hypothetical protein EV385_1163 [Krasilnikovia cinnamomea]|uniref:DUF7144 domain-containing protein n=1 Tax=Krasilnikovia cinnamomea TaxID=349313 RepID=A0A4Q7ZGU5_9ACTN|nr:hypothetical protein [Krasilnikovia cinnamomea]RZU49413.1 hypothetical protein EV385_1163 [Krasilnikovia cinnamomea]
MGMVTPASYGPSRPWPGPDPPYTRVQHSEATDWVAWVLFGGILLVLFGAVHLGSGLVALWRPEILHGSRADMLLPIGLTALAWTQVVLGAVALVVGVGLMRGPRWARVGAVVLGGLSMLVDFAFIGVYPVWSVTAMILATVVIYAVVVHGGEVASAYADR